MFRKIGALALLAALFCQPVSAEEFGRVAFNFDAEESEWFTVINQDSERTIASAEITTFGSLSTLAINAYREPRFSAQEILNIQVTYSRGFSGNEEPDYSRPAGVGITLFTEGMSGPVWDGRNVQIDIEAYDLSGDIGQITATFSAELCRAEELYADPDESTCRPISGTVETQVRIPAQD